MNFTAQSTRPENALSLTAAMAAAVSAFPGLAGGQGISAQFGSMTNDQMYTLGPSTGKRTYVARDRRVWLVTFPDAVIPSLYPNSKLPPQHGLNVVVDAFTGQYLFAYSHGDGRD